MLHLVTISCSLQLLDTLFDFLAKGLFVQAICMMSFIMFSTHDIKVYSGLSYMRCVPPKKKKSIFMLICNDLILTDAFLPCKGQEYSLLKINAFVKMLTFQFPQDMQTISGLQV